MGKQIKATTTKAVVTYDNDKEYTIPRCEDLTLEKGIVLKGKYTTKRQGLKVDSSFELSLKNVKSVYIRGTEGLKDTYISVKNGVVSGITEYGVGYNTLESSLRVEKYLISKWVHVDKTLVNIHSHY